jgi:eukaryotic-like serine/threonine-protein kinase
MTDLENRVLAGNEPDPVFLELTEQITRRLQSGEEIDVRDYLTRYPQWAGAICDLLPTMQNLVDYGRSIVPDRRREQRQKPCS